MWIVDCNRRRSTAKLPIVEAAGVNPTPRKREVFTIYKHIYYMYETDTQSALRNTLYMHSP